MLRPVYWVAFCTFCITAYRLRQMRSARAIVLIFIIRIVAVRYHLALPKFYLKNHTPNHRIYLYQVDAFTDRLLVLNWLPLYRWKWLPARPDTTTGCGEQPEQKLFFFVPADTTDSEQFDYSIRWFTPETEINLCGHATLASAWVLYTIRLSETSTRFNS